MHLAKPTEPLPEWIVTADQVWLWPGGIIPYEIDPVLKSTADIQAAIRHWNERTITRDRFFCPSTSRPRVKEHKAPLSDMDLLPDMGCSASPCG